MQKVPQNFFTLRLFCAR